MESLVAFVSDNQLTAGALTCRLLQWSCERHDSHTDSLLQFLLHQWQLHPFNTTQWSCLLFSCVNFVIYCLQFAHFYRTHAFCIMSTNDCTSQKHNCFKWSDKYMHIWFCRLNWHFIFSWSSLMSSHLATTSVYACTSYLRFNLSVAKHKHMLCIRLSLYWAALIIDM